MSAPRVERGIGGTEAGDKSRGLGPNWWQWRVALGDVIAWDELDVVGEGQDCFSCLGLTSCGIHLKSVVRS